MRIILEFREALQKYSRMVPLAMLLLFSGIGFSCETDDVSAPDPKVSMTVDNSLIAENLGTASITVSLSNRTDQEVSISFVSAGTASSTDYTISSTTLNIPAGELTGSITLTAIQDDTEEGNETIEVSIQSVSGGEEEGTQQIVVTIEDDDVPIEVQLVLNEICYDPSNSGLAGDTNGDGAYAQAEDEFLEFVNLSSAEVDLSGYEIFDEENLALDIPNHIIPANTIIPSGGALVIFGGGTPTGSFGGSTVQTSTTGNLNLNNAGDIMYVYDADGELVLSFDITPLSNNPNESYTRSPELTGEFMQHSSVTTGVLFSPGTKADGTAF